MIQLHKNFSCEAMNINQLYVYVSAQRRLEKKSDEWLDLAIGLLVPLAKLLYVFICNIFSRAG